MIENALARKKVLLVLDDIDSLDQLDALLGNKGFHPGSKIIITTKNSSMTKWCPLMTPQVQPTHTTHLLKGLSETASWELLYLNAFKCEDSKEGYEEVSDNIVKYCEGHPLALKVLGRSLYNEDVAYWKEYIKELKREPKFDINKVLKMSFDTLPSRNDRELFLHIACFFDGMDKDISETILSACDDINLKTGIPNLINRCLLRIERNQLTMHSLIQEMGRDVVRQESPAHPEKRTRLWCHEDSFKVLKKKKGTDNIKGLVLDMRMLDEEKLRGSNELKIDALNNMDNLMILHLNYVEINQFYENFPEELRWLCMQGFPLKSIPSDLLMFYLVVLDMSYSNIESFGVSDSNSELPVKKLKLIGSCSKNKPLLGSLKILDLSFCKQLRSLGGFCELPTLEKLIVKNCTSLIEVCESVEQCGELVLVDFSYCYEWRKFAKTIDKLKNVKTLLLDGCNLSEFPFKVRDMDSQKMPKANSIEINSQTSSFAIVEAIPRDLKSLAISLPRSLVSLSLAYNNLSNESFPMDFSCLSMLKELILDGNPIVSMPNCVRTLPRLDLLGMADCKMLMSIDQPPPTLTVLSYNPGNRYPHDNQSFLRKIVFDPEMLPLKLLAIFNDLPLSSTEVEGVVKIQPMEGVEETVLRSLGWSNLEFIKKRRVVVYHHKSGPHGSQTQMYYEFGIFSTFYGGEEMPNWIEDRNEGPSISFTIPSYPKKLRGLNFCYVETIAIQDETSEDLVDQLFILPVIKISNITKNSTWIYRHYITDRVKVGGAWLTFISHWMFGMDDMEAGDYITITAKHYEYEGTSVGHYKQKTLKTKCGVSFMYDDGVNKEEEEDAVLDYYKSWNHIIGGDLSHFQLTTGEYVMDKDRFTFFNFPFNPFIDTDAVYKEMIARFKALSQREVQRNWSGN